MSTVEEKLSELGLELPAPPPPGGTYHPIVIVDNVCYVSGHGPMTTEGKLIRGKVGGDITEEEGHAAARQVGLTMLATLKARLGGFDRIERFVKVLGMVNATPEFGRHPQVINGFSDLMVRLFGDEHGKCARSAVGMGSLPGNIAVEIEAIVQLKA